MTWPVALRLGRVSNLPTVWTNSVAGVVLVGGSLELLPLALLLLSMSLFYTGGMYLNDAFDRRWDTQSRPERPIPSRQVSARAVFAAGFSLLAAGVGTLAAAGFGAESGQGWPPVLSGLGLAGAIIYYDFHHKTNPLSPFFMGLCRVLVYLTAALSVAPTPQGRLVWGAVMLLAYLVGLTYAAKQESLGRIKNTWPLIFLATPFLYLLPLAVDTPGTGALYLAFLLWVLYALYHLLRRGSINVPLAVGTLIAGISLLDALLIGLQGELAIAGLAVAGAVLTRGLQRFVPGT